MIRRPSAQRLGEARRRRALYSGLDGSGGPRRRLVTDSSRNELMSVLFPLLVSPNRRRCLRGFSSPTQLVMSLQRGRCVVVAISDTVHTLCSKRGAYWAGAHARSASTGPASLSSPPQAHAEHWLSAQSGQAADGAGWVAGRGRACGCMRALRSRHSSSSRRSN